MTDQTTNGLLDFLEASPSCFHVIANIRKELTDRGYAELFEGDSWKMTPGGKYFAARNESSVIAFRIPEGEAKGFMIAASHSDSPSFKVKANPEMKGEKGAYVKLNVEKYGGMLIYPWFDRPLSVAGRVIVKEADGSFATRLVNVDRDLLMLPSLAIHMDREANDGHKIKIQSEILPVLGDETAGGMFWDIIAEAAGVSKDAILGHDLFLYVRGRGYFWGVHEEFVSAGHLDDLQCGYADLQGFLASEGAENSSVPVLAIFDNEEVGSGTKQGADSTFLGDVLVRVNRALGGDEETLRTRIASSFMLSADNAHAVHPNHPEKADPNNRPLMNQGIVIKYNANQKYTTDAVSAAVFKELCSRAGVPVQEFTNNSDIAGGSTLGNISNAHISLNTVDIGLPQLAMHSPVETAGVRDTDYLVRASQVFFSSSLTDLGQGRFGLK